MNSVLFVGTSDAFGAGGRRQSAYLLRGESGTVLLDCGATTLTGLSSLGVERDEIDLISISHFHADHFSGIPSFILASTYEDRRKKPLFIAGPIGIEDRIRKASSILGHPINDANRHFQLNFIELVAGGYYSIGPATLTPFATYHPPEVKPHGFVVSISKRQVAYSGDTGWFGELPSKVAGSDLFICECTQLEPDYPYHLSLDELSGNSHLFDCGRLILSHLGSAMRSQSEHRGFEIADDGLLVNL